MGHLSTSEGVLPHGFAPGRDPGAHAMSEPMANGHHVVVASYAVDSQLCLGLEQSGCRLSRVESPQRLDSWHRRYASLIVIGAGERSLAWLRQHREKCASAVVMCCERGSLSDPVPALKAGADEVLTESMGVRERVARIRRVLRGNRPQLGGAIPDQAYFDGWRFCIRTRRLDAPTGDEVALTDREFQLLLAFVTQPGVTLTREFLMMAVAGVTWAALDRRIDVLVSRLRTKLGCGNGRRNPLIKTVRGQGYCFVGNATLT